MNKHLLYLALVSAASLPLTACSGDAQHHAEVAKLGADVMPFQLNATTHVFTKSSDGGTQRVITKDASDAAQVRLVREHLREIQKQFRKGDFSGPSYIHGNDMPGLVELKAAATGQIGITYREMEDGAELKYRTANAKLVSVLHAWFDAQLSDHGADAMEGHPHRHGDKQKQ